MVTITLPAAALVAVAASAAPTIEALDEAGRRLAIGDSVTLWDRTEDGYRVRVITDITLVQGDTVVLELGMDHSFPYLQIPEEVNLYRRA